MQPSLRILAICWVILMAIPGEIRAQIPCLSGQVTDLSTGAPVAGGDLDFLRVSDGVKLRTPGDNTSLIGFYQVCVLPGVYHVLYAPPPGTRLMGRRIENVDLRFGSMMLNVALAPGTVVSGTVTSPLGPAGNVDVDVDRLTGGRVYTPDDDTNVLGVYRIVFPNGDYRIRFEPPRGSRVRGLVIDSVTVSADTTIDVSLPVGVLLSGRVTDDQLQPAAVPGIEVDLRDVATGKRIFLANDKTDTAPAPFVNYTVAVPTGLFELRYAPPRGSRFVGVVVDSFSISGDLRRDQTLESGVIVTAEVRDTLGNPVAGVDIDFKLDLTNQKIFTPNDETDTLGVAQLTVPPAVYTVQIDPPLGTTFDQLIVPGISIQSDTTLALTMLEVPRVMVTGRVTDPTGGGLADVAIDGNLQPSGRKVFIPVNTTDATGNFNLSIPLGTYDVFVAPPPGSRSVGRKLPDMTVDKDSTWATVVLENGILVTVNVVDDRGIPVGRVDVDFTPESSGVEVFTPHDNTDARGKATVAIPPDRYLIELEPLAGSGVQGVVASGVDIRVDTTLMLTLLRTRVAVPPPGVLSQNYPNPFTSQTVIPYEVSVASEVSIEVYNVLGKRVKVLENDFHAANLFQTMWDGTNSAGQRVAGGVYFVRLRTPAGRLTRKITVVR